MTFDDLELNEAINRWAVTRINKGKAKRRIFGVRGYAEMFNSETASDLTITVDEMRAWLVSKGFSVNPKTDKCDAYPILKRTA